MLFRKYIFALAGGGGNGHFLCIDHRAEGAAPGLVPLLVGLGIAGSRAGGTAALVTGDSDYSTLSGQVAKESRGS